MISPHGCTYYTRARSALRPPAARFTCQSLCRGQSAAKLAASHVLVLHACVRVRRCKAGLPFCQCAVRPPPPSMTFNRARSLRNRNTTKEGKYKGPMIGNRGHGDQNHGSLFPDIPYEHAIRRPRVLTTWYSKLYHTRCSSGSSSKNLSPLYDLSIAGSRATRRQTLTAPPIPCACPRVG